MRKLLLPIFLGFSLIGCEESEPPKKSEVPFINVLSITPTTVREFSDSIVIELQYADGNGDIGWVDADQYALTVQDARLLNADNYYIPPLAPIDSEIPISGVLKVKLKNTFLLGSGGDETTNFELILTDREGNVSNPSVTEDITIVKN